MKEFFTLLNNVLLAVMVIFGSAVVLYNVGRAWRNRVTRAFSTLVIFVVIVYLIELLNNIGITGTTATTETAGIIITKETWLRLIWIGISMVPAAQYHLSDALLSATGVATSRRRLLARGGYLISLLFVVAAYSTDWIVLHISSGIEGADYLERGPLFPLFAIYYWLVTSASIYNVWRARGRCITPTTRQRMTTTLFAFLAAPLGVFPYTLIVKGLNPDDFSIWLEVILMVGNLIVGLMLAILTTQLIYFGADSPDRVMRVRLYKYMARVPLAGTIVLLVYVLVSGTEPLGLDTETALGFSLVATVMLVEWLIHANKRPLERLFHLNDDPEIRLIQGLSERLLTTKELREFLESVLAVTCEVLQTTTAFVIVTTTNGAKLEAVVGPLIEAEMTLKETDLRELAKSGRQNGDDSTQITNSFPVVDGFILWQNYWLRPLYNQPQSEMLGLFGILARSPQPDLSTEEQALVERLITRAQIALEDRILQQEVFATVRNLLPGITALQQERTQAGFTGQPVLTASVPEPDNLLIDNPEFSTMVRDALSHYWGGPKLTESPLMRLEIVQNALGEHNNNPTTTLRTILNRAIELQKPEGERNLSATEWILYNILELKFIQGKRVRDVARRLSMSESDLYRKQRIALENVARTIATMETAIHQQNPDQEE